MCKFSAKVTTISSLVVHANAESSIKVDDVGSVLVSVHAKNSSEVNETYGYVFEDVDRYL